MLKLFHLYREENSNLKGTGAIMIFLSVLQINILASDLLARKVNAVLYACFIITIN